MYGLSCGKKFTEKKRRPNTRDNWCQVILNWIAHVKKIFPSNNVVNFERYTCYRISLHMLWIYYRLKDWSMKWWNNDWSGFNYIRSVTLFLKKSDLFTSDCHQIAQYLFLSMYLTEATNNLIIYPPNKRNFLVSYLVARNHNFVSESNDRI